MRERKYLNLSIVFWTKLKIAAMPMIRTIPYQKYLANALPAICKSLSSRICPRKSMAWVAFERSRPEAFKAEDEWSPMEGMGIDISILVTR